MPTNTVPIYARVDIKKCVAIARWLKSNGRPDVSRGKSRIIAASIDLLHAILLHQDGFEVIEDVEEALLLLDTWGIGFTDKRAKLAAANAISLDVDFDLRSLVNSSNDQEAEEIVSARIEELLKHKEESE